MSLVQTVLVFDSCDQCGAQGICVSVLTTRSETTVCTPCLLTDTRLVEVTGGGF